MGSIVVRYTRADGKEKTKKFEDNVANAYLNDLDIASVDLSPLLRCRTLQALFLYKNHLKQIDFSSLDRYSVLEKLVLGMNQLQQIDLSPLQHCSLFKRIELGNNQLTTIDLTPLQYCQNLLSIDLRNNQLIQVDLEPLQRCSSLRTIWLSENQLTEIDLWPLQRCTQLRSLALAKNKLATVDISPLYSCTNLEGFSLDKSVAAIANPRLQKTTPPQAIKALLDAGRVIWQYSDEHRPYDVEEEGVYKEDLFSWEEWLRWVLERRDRIPVTQFVRRLHFPNMDAFVAWMITLPEDTPLRVNRDNMVVWTGTTREEIDQLVALIQKAEKPEETRRSLKSEK